MGGSGQVQDLEYLGDGGEASAAEEAILGTRSMQVVVFDFTTDVATGDGKFYVVTPPEIDGMNLTEVFARVITAGTTGTTDIQVHNVSTANDMLSTVVTIDSGEVSSATAATPPVIDTDNDGVLENDLLRIDVDAVSTTAPEGLIINLRFAFPE